TLLPECGVSGLRRLEKLDPVFEGTLEASRRHCQQYPGRNVAAVSLCVRRPARDQDIRTGRVFSKAAANVDGQYPLQHIERFVRMVVPMQIRVVARHLL